MIEAASRSLRQQMNRGPARERPRSKGSLHDASVGGTASWQEDEPRNEPENAQRRIRSAENQHRMVQRTSPQASFPVEARASASATDNYPLEDAADDEVAAAQTPQEDGVSRMFPTDLHQELKRPLSRKKDPSESAASGLGTFSGPSRLTDAFEQKKTRQPIPVESWGPRPPSRGGQQKPSAQLDAGLGDALLSAAPSRGSGPGPSVSRSSSRPGGAQTPGGNRPGAGGGAQTPGGSRPSSKVGGEQSMGAKVTGGTWAAARTEPWAVHEPATRRGRERRTSNRDRGTPEVGQAVGYAAAADLGVFGCGTRAPPNNQQLTKSLSGVFEQHSNQMPRQAHAPSRAAGSTADSPGMLEVSGCGIEHHVPEGAAASSSAAATWPGSPAQSSGGGSPPTRKGPRHSLTDPVAVEDVEAADQDISTHFRRGADAIHPQVIVTRSREQAEQNQHQQQRRGPALRRGSADQRGSSKRDQREQREPQLQFSTSLDVDFLSLFAS